MREQLISYVDLLFAATNDAEEIKQEILQNTLDRYDDLLEQGKTPQAAYSLAISGIGDINEILEHTASPTSTEVSHAPAVPAEPAKNKKLMRAIAVAMYICCAVPVIVLSTYGESILGIVLMFLIIAAATVLMILSDDGRKKNESNCGCDTSQTKRDPLRRTIGRIITTVSLCVYLLVSFATGAWYITWLIFPIAGALNQLINACMDLKEAN